MIKRLLAVSALLLIPHFAHAQSVANSFDPCTSMPKQSAAINISSATDTQLVAASAGSSVYVCSMVLNQANGTGTLGLEYGTGTNCATGKTSLQGPIIASTVASGVTNTMLKQTLSGVQMVAPASNAVCAISTGTIQQSGYISYVQTSDITHISNIDPCTVLPKLSVPIDTAASAATVSLVAAVANTPIHVCGFTLSQQATASESLKLEYGTKVSTACDTGATNLTGPIAPSQVSTTATMLTAGATSSGTQLEVPAGNQLCAVTGASTGQQSGWLSYVQQPSVISAAFFDPCVVYPKQTAPFAFSSATTTQIIAPPPSGTQTYICGVQYEDAGRATTANTFKLEYGTKASTDCDTGATEIGGPLTGALTAGTPTFLLDAGFGTQLVAPTQQQVCGVTTQSTAVNGVVSYVQK